MHVFCRQMNDGPLCRCSTENMHFGIRHNIYPGEEVVKLVHAFATFLCVWTCTRQMMMAHTVLSLASYSEFLMLCKIGQYLMKLW